MTKIKLEVTVQSSRDIKHFQIDAKSIRPTKTKWSNGMRPTVKDFIPLGDAFQLAHKPNIINICISLISDMFVAFRKNRIRLETAKYGKRPTARRFQLAIFKSKPQDADHLNTANRRTVSQFSQKSIPSQIKSQKN